MVNIGNEIELNISRFLNKFSCSTCKKNTKAYLISI